MLPTKTPTSRPTVNCTTLSKSACQSFSYCSWWGKTKTCLFQNAPTLSPVTEPTGPTAPSPIAEPTGSACSSSNCGGCSGGGECRAAGCTWTKGTCS